MNCWVLAGRDVGGSLGCSRLTEKEVGLCATGLDGG